MIEQQAIDAILFDLDGTLVDTDDAAVERLAGRLRTISRPFSRRDPTALARWLMMQAESPGNSLLTLLDVLGLDGPLSRASDRWQSWRGLSRAVDLSPIEGIPTMLEQLAGRFKLALVTSRGSRHIAAFRAANPDIARHLHSFVGRQDTQRMKPHPEPLHLAAERLGVPIERCLMVGDTPVDVRAARRANAWSVAVLCGFGQRRELERAGAHHVLASTADLHRLFD